MIMADVKNDLREKIKGNIAYLKEELNTVRADKANPLLLDKVLVEYYGTPTPCALHALSDIKRDMGFPIIPPAN